MSGERLQAKDISDVEMLEAVREAGTGSSGWAMAWDVDALNPAYPPKVQQAKRSKLIKRGLMEGCTCGCRGDFYLTDSGLALLNDSATPSNPTPNPDRGDR